MTKKKARPNRRNTNVRQRPVRPWPSDADDERVRDALARELIGTCMAALKSFGLDGGKLAKLATQVTLGSAKQPSTATEVWTDADQLGRAISRWAEEPAYRDTTGRPAVLSMRDAGPDSFQTLAQDFFPGWAVADVVTLGSKANVLEKVGADKVALLNNCVLSPQNSPLVLAFAIRTVRRVLQAADNNRHVKSAEEGWPDRAVWVKVPDEDFRDFVKFIRPQIGGLLELSHRWLTRRAALPKNRRKTKRLVGIQMFVFRE
jgi:hypothetical protein